MGAWRDRAAAAAAAGVRRCGEGQFGGGPVVAFTAGVISFWVFSLSLSDSLSLNSSIQRLNKFGIFFVFVQGTAHRTVSFGIFFFFPE